MLRQPFPASLTAKQAQDSDVKNVDVKLLLTGILAGITATFLVLAASAQASMSALFYAASSLPILIVGLRWGNFAALTAIASAAICSALIVSPVFALSIAIFTLGPAGWLSHLANLARPAEEIGGPANLLAWYPLSDILLHLCALVTLGVIFLGFMIGYDQALVSQMVDGLVSAVSSREPDFDVQNVDGLKSTLLLTIPIVQGGMWVLLMFTGFYLAMRIVSASGHNLRPREDMPSALRMNRNSPFVFLFGIAACFVGGVPALIGATICGTFGAGFLLAGFASLHLRARGKEWRVPALILSYLATLFVLPAILIVILGLIDTRRTVALTKPRNGGQSNHNGPQN